nr:hypothetical protein [Palleronia marisminoris]
MLFGRYFSWLIARAIFSAVLSETEPFPETYRDTVPEPTPASFATSFNVAVFCSSMPPLREKYPPLLHVIVQDQPGSVAWNEELEPVVAGTIDRSKTSWLVLEPVPYEDVEQVAALVIVRR